MIGQPKLNHRKRDFLSLEVNGFWRIPYCSSPWPCSHRNRYITSWLKRWVILSTNTASLGIRGLPRALSHLYWHKYDFICVGFFCDCQSQNKNGFWIDSYDRKVSVKWAAFLLAVSSSWFARELYLSLFNSPQFLTASKPSEFSPTLTSTTEQTTDNGRLFTGPNARNWPASQDATKTEMSVARVHQVHVHKISCSTSS